MDAGDTADLPVVPIGARGFPGGTDRDLYRGTDLHRQTLPIIY